MSDDLFILQPNPSVGYWQIGGKVGLRVYVSERPRWLTQVMSRWLFQWEWYDEPKGK